MSPCHVLHRIGPGRGLDDPTVYHDYDYRELVAAMEFFFFWVG